MRNRKLAAGILLVLHLSGCSSWRAEQVAPTQLFEQQSPNHVRVVRADGTQLALAHPAIVSDTLTGSVGDSTVRVPLTDVRTLSTRHGDVGKSLVLTGGILGGLLVMAAIAAPDWQLFEAQQ